MLLIIGAIIGVWVSRVNFIGRRIIFSHTDKLWRTVRLVRDNYVDTVNTDSIEGETVNHFLQSLDPHSLYLPPQRASSLNETLDGGFDGIGIAYLVLQDTLYISQVMHNGPAAKAGLQPGDKVLTVNHKPFAGTHLDDNHIDILFKGQKNSVLQLGVLHGNPAQIKQLSITRGRVPLSSIDAAYMAAPQTGYVKVGRFAATTDRDFKQAVQKLKTQGMQKLVLDLRGNGGGYLNAATAMADEFLPGGKLIMFTQGAHEPRTDYFSTDSGVFEKGKLAVMINEYSASASEILAGAMQDLDRATIVGRRSFGKGLVQEQFPFTDGSAINLTVARYYTPSGRCIQKSYKNGAAEYRNELAARTQKGELLSAKNNMADSSFKQPSNYRTAKGRKVYAGGGIMPDVFVPADINANTRLLYYLDDQRLYEAYVLQHLQNTLSRYHSYETFSKNYHVSDAEFNNFIIYASQSIKEMDSDELRRSAAGIRLNLKAAAARFKWGDEAYYRTLNHNDPTLRKAIEAL